jgi:hypothetical protein
MPTVSTPAALPSHIEDLLSTRDSHLEAIAVIDATLARVSSALGVGPTPLTKPAPVASAAKAVAPKPAAAKKVAPKLAAPKPAAKAAAAPKKKGPPSKFGLSANDFVLAFIGSSKGGATTQEINKHWIDSGRPRNADNSLSILTKAKKLKRAKLPHVAGGPRGSRFTLA